MPPPPPANLEQRFNTLLTYKPITPAKLIAKVARDDWKLEWDHPQILQEFLSDTPPASIDTLPYEFNRDDTTANDILTTLNSHQIAADMKQHTLNVKRQENSRIHPKFVPFKLQSIDSGNDSYTVLNCKDDQAYTF